MSYPGPKVHRVSRRKLGRGQAHVAASVGCTITGATPVVTLTFDRPVVVSGPVQFSCGTLTIAAQSTPNPTTVLLTMSGPITGLAYSLQGPQDNIRTAQGGNVAGTTGTF